MTAADNACSYLHVLSTAMVVKALLDKPFTGPFFPFIKNISHKEKQQHSQCTHWQEFSPGLASHWSPLRREALLTFSCKCCPGIYLLQVKKKVSRIRGCDLGHPLFQSNWWCLVKPLACSLEAVSENSCESPDQKKIGSRISMPLKSSTALDSYARKQRLTSIQTFLTIMKTLKLSRKASGASSPILIH